MCLLQAEMWPAVLFSVLFIGMVAWSYYIDGT